MTEARKVALAYTILFAVLALAPQDDIAFLFIAMAGVFGFAASHTALDDHEVLR